MTITNKALNNRTKPFYKLKCGDVFIFNGEYYMVIQEVECDDAYNALCLNNFKVTDFSDGEEVFVVDAELAVDY